MERSRGATIIWFAHLSDYRECRTGRSLVKDAFGAAFRGRFALLDKVSPGAFWPG